jgi:hypothetical protein
LSAVCHCLFNIFAATFHIWRPFLDPQNDDTKCCGDRDALSVVRSRSFRPDIEKPRQRGVAAFLQPHHWTNHNDVRGWAQNFPAWPTF